MPDLKPADAAAAAAAGEKKPQDFEGAFSEFAKAKSEESAPASSAPAAPAAADKEPKSDEPGAAAKPAAGESAAGDGTAAAAPAAAAAADPWKDAPQPLREAHERSLAEERRKAEAAEQKAKSAEGRYKAANSKLADVERKLGAGASSAAAPASQPAAASAAASAAAPAASAAAKPAPASGDPAAAADTAPQMPPEWKQLVESLPDVAKAVEARFGAVDKAVKDALAAVKPLQEGEVVRFKREQGVLLDEAYPGWNKAVKTSEFSTWIKQQPQSVQALALSDYAADNAALLEYYGYTPPKENPEPPAPAAPGGKSPAEIAAEREARLARNTAVRGNGSAPIADAPDNFEAAFSFYARKRMEATRRSA